MRHKTKSKPSFFPLLFTPFLLFPFGRKRKRKEEEVEAWICMRGREWPDGLMGKVFSETPVFRLLRVVFALNNSPERGEKNEEGGWTKKSLMSFGDLPIHIKVCAFFVASLEVTPSDPNPMSAPKAKREIILGGCRTSRCCLDQVFIWFFTRGLWYVLRPLHQLDCVWGFPFALISWLKPKNFFLGKMQMQTKSRGLKQEWQSIFPENCRALWQGLEPRKRIKKRLHRPRPQLRPR